MKWLFVTSKFPWPIIHGRWLRVYHLARVLVELGERVFVLSCRATDEGRSAYAKIGVAVADGLERIHLNRGRGRCLFAPIAFDANFADVVQHHAADFDIVVLSGTRMLQYAKEASLAGTVVSEMVDDPLLEFGRRETGERASIKLRLRSRINRFGQIRLERICSRFVTFTSFVSEEDCANFNSRHPDDRTVFVPNGVDVDYFDKPIFANSNSDTEVPTVVFTGHMSNPNNERAATFLVRKIAPLIWHELPNARIQIVGSDPSEAVRALASSRIEVTGLVDDIRPFLWNASVVLLSMQSGTGIKNKLLEAWAASAPVVATPLACQGVPAKDGKNLLLADSGEALSQATIKLIQDPVSRQKIAEAGRKTVMAKLTWTSAAQRIKQAVSGEQSLCL